MSRAPLRMSSRFYNITGFAEGWQLAKNGFRVGLLILAPNSDTGHFVSIQVILGQLTVGIEWHYSRTELAAKILSLYEVGLSQALTLFAPIHMGKTEFVLVDFIPKATQCGYIPVYVNLSENSVDPVLSLLDAVHVALNESSWWRRTTQKFAYARAPLHDRNAMSVLREALNTLVARHDRVLLCLDEAQHLAAKSEFKVLVFFLRTFLDQHRERIKVMYTGSSRDGLQKLFNDRKAPLFKSSSQIDLPQLGSGFVDHMRQCYKQATTHDFSLQDGLIAFGAVNYVPREFRSLLDSMIVSGSHDIIQEVSTRRR